MTDDIWLSSDGNRNKKALATSTFLSSLKNCTQLKSKSKSLLDKRKEIPTSPTSNQLDKKSMRFPSISIDNPIRLVTLCVIFAGLNVPSEAIKCFRCSSSESDKCTKESASEPAINMTECHKDPYNMVKDVVFGFDLKKYGLGEFNIEKALEKADEHGTDLAGIEDHVFCAYIYASNENKATEAVDKGVSKVARVFNSDHKEGATILRFVHRDCVMLKVREEDKKQFDQCIPLQEKDLFKFYMCTCAEDECNEGPEKSEMLRTLIAESNVHGNGVDAKVNLSVLITISVMELMRFLL